MVTANLAGSTANPGANTQASTGAPRVASTVSVSSAAPSVPATRSSRSRTAAWVPFSRYSASTGTNAWLKAPSANSRRKKLGSLKATKKASASPSAPMVRANTISRSSPATRDNPVMAPTIRLERRRPRCREGGAGVERSDACNRMSPRNFAQCSEHGSGGQERGAALALAGPRQVRDNASPARDRHRAATFPQTQAARHAHRTR